jgi:protein-tyrosine phosphatase
VTFQLLYVCTGNICRSPMGERLFRSRTSASPEITISSAGTSGLTGYEMDPPSATVLRELGGDPEGHAARRLTPELIQRADLVLTAVSEQRALILKAEPMAFRRTFTMREFARLSAGFPPLDRVSAEALRSRVREIAARRGFTDPAGPGDDEIGDPFGAPLEFARATGTQISESVDAAIDGLGLRRRPRPAGSRPAGSGVRPA